jgi:dephospho-CoA kinase
MKLIGLTGGVACGKTTVSSQFEALGVPVIDADLLAREVVEPGERGHRQVVEHFGKSILDESGAIDRRQLRQIVFSDQTERKWLESVVHPLVKERIQKRLAGIDAEYAVIVVPLLVESDMLDWFDRILVIDTEPQTQLNRLTARDAIDSALAERMMAAQTDRQKRLSCGDDILYNNSDLNHVALEVSRLHRRYSGCAVDDQKQGKVNDNL